MLLHACCGGILAQLAQKIIVGRKNKAERTRREEPAEVMRREALARAQTTSGSQAQQSNAPLGSASTTQAGSAHHSDTPSHDHIKQGNPVQVHVHSHASDAAAPTAGASSATAGTGDISRDTPEMSSSRPRGAADGGTTARHLRMDDAVAVRDSALEGSAAAAPLPSASAPVPRADLLKELFKQMRALQVSSGGGRTAQHPTQASQSARRTRRGADGGGGGASRRGGGSSSRAGSKAAQRKTFLEIAQRVLASKQAEAHPSRSRRSRHQEAASSSGSSSPPAPPSAPFASKDMANILLGRSSPSGAASRGSPGSATGSATAAAKRPKAGTRAQLAEQVSELQAQLDAAQASLRDATAQNAQLSQSLRVAAQSLHAGVGSASASAAQCGAALTEACSNASALTAGVARDAFSAGFSAGLYTVQVLVDAESLTSAAAAALAAPGGRAKRARRALHATGVLSTEASGASDETASTPAAAADTAGLKQLEAEAAELLMLDPPAPYLGASMGGRKRPRHELELSSEPQSAGCATCRLVFGHNPVPAPSVQSGAVDIPDSATVLSALRDWPTALHDPQQWVRTVRAVVGTTPATSLAAAARNPQALQLAAGAAASAFMSATDSWCGSRSGTALQDAIERATGDLRAMRSAESEGGVC